MRWDILISCSDWYCSIIASANFSFSLTYSNHCFCWSTMGLRTALVWNKGSRTREYVSNIEWVDEYGRELRCFTLFVDYTLPFVQYGTRQYCEFAVSIVTMRCVIKSLLAAFRTICTDAGMKLFGLMLLQNSCADCEIIDGRLYAVCWEFEGGEWGGEGNASSWRRWKYEENDDVGVPLADSGQSACITDMSIRKKKLC